MTAGDRWVCLMESGPEAEVVITVSDPLSLLVPAVGQEVAVTQAESQTGALCWSAFRPDHPEDWTPPLTWRAP